MSLSITFAWFHGVVARVIRLLYAAGLAGILFSSIGETSLAQSVCGGYGTTRQGCRRVAVLAWYTAQPGVWETELRVDAGSASGVKFSYLPAFALAYDGIGHNLLMNDDERGEFIAEEVDGIRLGGRRSYRSTVLGSTSCQRGACTLDYGVSTGSLLLIFDGPDAAALENTSADVVNRHFASNGTLDSQVAAPAVFLDQASNEWRASITEIPDTPVSGGSHTMFAVANLSSVDQAVRVEVFNKSGELIASGITPVLAGATGYLGDMGSVGGVHANLLASLPGINLPRGPVQGRLVFKGDAGGPIAPVVFQANGSLMISPPVSPSR